MDRKDKDKRAAPDAARVGWTLERPVDDPGGLVVVIEDGAAVIFYLPPGVDIEEGNDGDSADAVRGD